MHPEAEMKQKTWQWKKNNANSDGNTSRFHSIGAVDWKERDMRRETCEGRRGKS